MIKSFLFELTRPAVIVYYVAVTLVFGVAGPFGTYEATDLVHRLAYWATIIAVAILIAGALRGLFSRVFAIRSFWRRELLCVGGFTIVFAPIFWMSIQWMAERDAALPLTLMGAFAFVAMVAVLSVALECVVAPSETPDQPAPDHAPDTVADLPPLLDRIGPENRSPVLSLRARDHYVDVTTHLGQEPVLIRMADAIDLLGETDGARVHRSHWVARAAVTGSQHRQGQLFLTLKNGEEIPVSRKYRERVEQSLLA